MHDHKPMITETQAAWAEALLDSGYGHPQEVRNAMLTVKLWREQCEAEVARLERKMQEEKASWRLTPDGQKIVTEFWMKPIPMREFDWTAITDNYDGADPPDPVGYGRTEDEAIADLLDQLEEKAS